MSHTYEMPVKTVNNAIFLRMGIAAILILMLAIPAAAQDEPYLEGKDRNDMLPLLRVLEANKIPRDPIIDQMIDISRWCSQYRNVTLDLPARNEAADQATEGFRKLIADHNEHPYRPIWQTDLAVTLQETMDLLHENAPIFVDVGLPINSQRDVFYRYATEAYEQLANADQRFYQLQSQLPRENDHQAKRVRTGLWQLMMEDYWRKRTRFWLGIAAYNVTLVDQSAAYYQTLGQNPLIPAQTQKDTFEKERRRLLLLCINQLKRFVTDNNAANVSYELHVRSLLWTGRANLALKRTDAAAKLFTQVIKAGKNDRLDDLIAQLSLAQTLAQRGRQDLAAKRLKETESHTLVVEVPLYRLLLADVEFKILLAKANDLKGDDRSKTVRQACKVYLDLLNNPAIADRRDALVNYIDQRLTDNIHLIDNLDDLPGEIIVGIARNLRIQGQRFLEQTIQSQQTGQLQAAVVSLQRSITYNSQVLTRPGISSANKAIASYNLALAQYFTSEAKPADAIAASKSLAQIADQHPDQPIAESAITDALALLYPLLDAETPSPTAVDAYSQTVEKILFSKFPTTVLADDERLYYVQKIALPQGRYQAAAALLNGLPPTHRDYPYAQRLLIESYFQQFENADPANQSIVAETIRIESDLLQRQIETKQQSLDPQNPDDQKIIAILTANLAYTKMLKGEMFAYEGAMIEAKDIFADVAENTGDDIELYAWAVDRQTDCLVQLDQHTQAVLLLINALTKTDNQLIARCEAVLQQLQIKIDDTEYLVATIDKPSIRQGQVQTLENLASQSAKLAQAMLDWADANEIPPDELVGLRLTYSRSLRLSGKSDQAIAITQPLLQSQPANAMVIHEHAEALFATGNDEQVKQAVSYFDRLIQSLPVDENGHYPPIYWNAWVRRLQALDQIGGQGDSITMQIRQLKYIDHDLGGEPYRTYLNQLADKFSQ